VASLAQVPELLEVALPFIATVLGASALSFRTEELVIVRISALTRCNYCVQAHSVMALDAGLSRDEIRALRGALPVDAVFTDPAERALLAWVEVVATGPGPVDPAVRERLRPHFADHEIVEFTLLAGATVMLNRYATTLELPTGADTLRRLAAEGLQWVSRAAPSPWRSRRVGSPAGCGCTPTTTATSRAPTA
jgi:AhpD family alkylhydroperoxidase